MHMEKIYLNHKVNSESYYLTIKNLSRSNEHHLLLYCQLDFELHCLSLVSIQKIPDTVKEVIWCWKMNVPTITRKGARTYHVAWSGYSGERWTAEQVSLWEVGQHCCEAKKFLIISFTNLQFLILFFIFCVYSFPSCVESLVDLFWGDHRKLWLLHSLCIFYYLHNIC